MRHPVNPNRLPSVFRITAKPLARRFDLLYPEISEPNSKASPDASIAVREPPTRTTMPKRNNGQRDCLKAEARLTVLVMPREVNELPNVRTIFSRSSGVFAQDSTVSVFPFSFSNQILRSPDPSCRVIRSMASVGQPRIVAHLPSPKSLNSAAVCAPL